MISETIEREFKQKVCDKVQLRSEGVDRFRVFTPFMFEDGDHLAIVLKKVAGAWLLSDEGHTYMDLTYDIDEKDLKTGTRQKIITNALSSLFVEDREGELVAGISDDQFGDALYSFIQAVLKVSDVTYLSRERVKSTFMEDFRNFIAERVPRERRQFDWHDPAHDPSGHYFVDCRINGSTSRPLFLYALQSDDKVRDATISVLQYERWQLPFRAAGVFEDQEEVNRRVLARFSDVVDKQFSNLYTNKDRIARYLD